jgi:hypothetical protein
MGEGLQLENQRDPAPRRVWPWCFHCEECRDVRVAARYVLVDMLTLPGDEVLIPLCRTCARETVSRYASPAKVYLWRMPARHGRRRRRSQTATA